MARGESHMSRIAKLNRDKLNADRQQLYDQILAGRRSVARPFRVWFHSPEFTRRATQLGEFQRYHTSLSPRLSELVILITTRRQESKVEWAIHEPLARKADLPRDIVEALQRDHRPTFAEAAEEAIYDHCEQLHRTHTADRRFSGSRVSLAARPPSRSRLRNQQ